MNQDNFAPRPKVQGNWSCSQCQAAITELPFEPDGDRPLYCRDCHKARKQEGPRRQF
ncbi:MAG: CxxC-x17-CxxC domain-containing protein [Patescibacteria group bacterium]